MAFFENQLKAAERKVGELETKIYRIQSSLGVFYDRQNRALFSADNPYQMRGGAITKFVDKREIASKRRGGCCADMEDDLAALQGKLNSARIHLSDIQAQQSQGEET